MSYTDLLVQVALAGLGGWRLASLLVNEDGPWNVFRRIRGLGGLREGDLEIPGGFFPGLFSCIWCMTVWTSTAVFVFASAFPVLAALPAAWAVAMLTEAWARR